MILDTKQASQLVKSSCSKCKYFHRSWTDKIFFMPKNFAECSHPESLKELDKIRNDPNFIPSKRNYLYCSNMRAFEFLCGKSGRYFTPK